LRFEHAAGEEQVAGAFLADLAEQEGSDDGRDKAEADLSESEF